MRILRARRAFAVLGAVAAIAAGLSGASADDPFYKGKRISLLINFAAGGPTDIEGRLFAKHMTKHIDGRPSFIVQNMDGAAGLAGTNHLGVVAPKDGTTLGYLTGAAWLYATAPERHRVDLRTYEFIAYQPGTTVYFVRTDVPPGMKEATDIVKAQGLISGGLSADGPKDILLRLALDMLGVPYKHVTGYRSNQNSRLALQQNEVNFLSESPPGYRSVVEPSLVKKGLVIPVFYDPGWNGETISVPKQVEGLDILPFQELYRKIKGADPSGQLWDVYLSVLAVNTTMQRTLALPPGAPQAAVDALRAAVLQLNEDKEFAEDAVNALGFVPTYEAGPRTNDEVRRALAVPADIRAFVADYVQKANK
jgi:tripartite-type tricarboxylate transporter receptor subunit TctC